MSNSKKLEKNILIISLTLQTVYSHYFGVYRSSINRVQGGQLLHALRALERFYYVHHK